MTPGPNGIKPNSGLKSLKSNCGKDKLCSCILSASAMDTIKSRIVRLTFAQTHYGCPYQEALSPSHIPGQALSLPAHSARPTEATASPAWIQYLWAFSQESQEVFFVTKLQWKLLSNSYINTYLTQDQYCCSSTHLNNNHYIQSRKHQLGYRIS